MPKRYKHLFEQIVSLENLFAAARKAMRGKRGKMPAAACFADLERVVVDLRDELVSGSWRMHPDKYRFGPTECGVDFVGFVMYPDGRVRMRDANVRRFERRFKQQAWAVRQGRMGLADLENRTRCWVAHTSHAQSYGLRKDLFRGH